jgi:hypothetical protein
MADQGDCLVSVSRAFPDRGPSRPSSHSTSQQVPHLDHHEVKLTLARLDGLARVMDSAVTIPGTKIVMGFDALLGLVPVIGDAISGIISSYIIWEARRLGVSRLVMARMVTNSTIDAVIGSVPFAGDIFDVAYKSNLKNVALLKRHIEKTGLAGPGTITASYTVE